MLCQSVEWTKISRGRPYVFEYTNRVLSKANNFIIYLMILYLSLKVY